MIGEINLRAKGICIPLTSISTSYLQKEHFRILSLKVFQTFAISHFLSQNRQVIIGL